MSKWIIGAAVLALIGGAAWWSGATRHIGLIGKTGLTVMCEEEALRRLRAPSTYKRIGVEERARDVSNADARAYCFGLEAVQAAACNTRVLKAGSTPTRFETVITYEAKNALGVPLRGRATCTYYDGKKAPPRRGDPLPESTITMGAT